MDEIKQTTPPRKRGNYPSRQITKLDRVLIDTSDKAAELARQWGTTKQEVYRWLVDLATEGEIHPTQK